MNESKNSQKVYALVLAYLSEYGEQLSRSYISPQEVKLRCGIRNVIVMRGPESKNFNLFDLRFYPYASKPLVDGFC